MVPVFSPPEADPPLADMSAAICEVLLPGAAQIEDEGRNHRGDSLEIDVTLFGEVVFEKLVIGAVFDAKGVRNIFNTFKGNTFFAVHIHDGVIGGFDGVDAKRGETLGAKCLKYGRHGLRSELRSEAFEELWGNGAGHGVNHTVSFLQNTIPSFDKLRAGLLVEALRKMSRGIILYPICPTTIRTSILNGKSVGKTPRFLRRVMIHLKRNTIFLLNFLIRRVRGCT
jgi:hypothetical protein